MKLVLFIVAVAMAAGVVSSKIAPVEPQAASKTFATGTVTRVVDGDTIVVGREKVRLIGIDTPESVKPGTLVECGAKQGAGFMEGLRGKRVSLRTDPSQATRDRYGRLLAYVDLEDGTDANEEIVRAGWAVVYVYGGKPFQRLSAYRRAMEAASSARRGVWSRCGGDFHGAA